jgi:hypothetical protein
MKKLLLALPLLLLGAAGPAAAHSPSLTVSVGPQYGYGGYGYAPPPVVVRPWHRHHYWRPYPVVVAPRRYYAPPAYYAPPRVVYRPYGYYGRY